MRELDLDAADDDDDAAAAADDDDDDDSVAEGAASAFGFNKAILLSRRCCMTMQRT
jgi:hypothetical protein